MAQALVVVDAQNEFSSQGKRAVPNHLAALAVIKQHVERARIEGRPIAWVRHHNKPHESAAFVPGSYGAEFSPGLGPLPNVPTEALFEKDVYGAFTGTNLEAWLRSVGADAVLIVGFYVHMCLSTAAREALIRGFDVFIDPDATGGRDLADPILGQQTADEVKRSALLQLTNMGVRLTTSTNRCEPAAPGVGCDRTFGVTEEGGERWQIGTVIL
jgi:nicotinamidase-related amidase